MSRDRLRIGANAAGIALFVALFVSAFVPTGHKDFDLYYYGGHVERNGSYTDTERVIETATADGADPTRNDVFGAPTLVALVFQPLSLIDRTAALRLWVAVSGIALLVALALASPRWWGVWAAALAAMVGLHVALRLGQASILMLALLVATWGLLRRGADRAAGTTLAVAISFKLFPVFLLIPLVAHRSRAALRALIVTLGVLGAATMIALGPGDVADAIRGTLDTASYVYPGKQNESIPGVLLRATNSQAFAKVVTTALTVLAAYTFLRRPTRRVWSTFGVATVVMLLVQSIAWDHYFPMTIVGFLTLAAVPSDRLRRPSTMVPAAIAYLLVAQAEPVTWMSTEGVFAIVNAPAFVGSVLLTWVLVREHAVRTRR